MRCVLRVRRPPEHLNGATYSACSQAAHQAGGGVIGHVYLGRNLADSLVVQGTERRGERGLCHSPGAGKP